MCLDLELRVNVSVRVRVGFRCRVRSISYRRGCSLLLCLLFFYGLIFRSRVFSAVLSLIGFLFLLPFLLYFVVLSFDLGLGWGLDLGWGWGLWGLGLGIVLGFGFGIVSCIFLPPPTKSTKRVVYSVEGYLRDLAVAISLVIYIVY